MDESLITFAVIDFNLSRKNVVSLDEYRRKKLLEKLEARELQAIEESQSSRMDQESGKKREADVLHFPRILNH